MNTIVDWYKVSLPTFLSAIMLMKKVGGFFAAHPLKSGCKVPLPS
ncbi:MAG: hypothetical protein ACLR8S_17455 [Paraprevotella clara]